MLSGITLEAADPEIDLFDNILWRFLHPPAALAALGGVSNVEDYGCSREGRLQEAKVGLEKLVGNIRPEIANFLEAGTTASFGRSQTSFQKCAAQSRRQGGLV